MRITLECYGFLTEICGTELELILADANTVTCVADVLTELTRQFPQVAEHLPGIACARGDELVGRQSPVAAGDRLALLPPVSGG